MARRQRMVTTILIVENHEETMKGIEGFVRMSFPECRTLQAGSAEAALALCASAAPQLVIMDISLPGINGIEATRRIKAFLPDTAVVMFSGHDETVYRDMAAAAGAGAFVSKSKAVSELLRVVTGLLPSR